MIFSTITIDSDYEIKLYSYTYVLLYSLLRSVIEIIMSNTLKTPNRTDI